MSYRLMFMINAIVAVVFGAAFLFLSKAALLFFGVNDAIGAVAMLVITRFFGGALMAIGGLLWFMQNSNKEVQRAEAAAMMVASVGGFILTIMGMSADKIIRANGWIPLTFFVLFAAGYAFLAFGLTVKKEE